MNCVYDILIEFGFHRFSNHHSEPFVVHCVPGAGKSTAIRKILSCLPEARAYTFGVCDPPSVCTCRIQGVREWDQATSTEFTIVDEYTEGDYIKLQPKLVFGDPCQSEHLSRVLRPHYTCLTTKRFGAETCAILRKLKFQIFSEKCDTVLQVGIFEGEPEGQVVAFEDEVKTLLNSHNCEYKGLCEIRGETYKCVTFVTATVGVPKQDIEKFFLCLTRHSEKLVILSPDAAFASC
ncbi:triple gene block protein 1 [Helleborus mosaic virus]|uniref:Triple gene block protein 1 n=1 Tax=Helleborus mosaic virus TaxID=592207 RepID=B9UZ42_9VIRU|nr:triple gene block protein 1 [Helleborus mosaic virus]ACM45998.1 triple gene block protein 1 [Helleborus mosaic virus]WPR15564.1 triple gene block protein 1 [Helleborus mosaic virus]